MNERRAPDAPPDPATCAYFARPGGSAGECLTEGDPKPIPEGYIAAYCVSARHVECSRYLAAQSGAATAAESSTPRRALPPARPARTRKTPAQPAVVEAQPELPAAAEASPERAPRSRGTARSRPAEHPAAPIAETPAETLPSRPPRAARRPARVRLRSVVARSAPPAVRASESVGDAVVRASAASAAPVVPAQPSIPAGTEAAASDHPTARDVVETAATDSGAAGQERLSVPARAGVEPADARDVSAQRTPPAEAPAGIPSSALGSENTGEPPADDTDPAVLADRDASSAAVPDGPAALDAARKEPRPAAPPDGAHAPDAARIPAAPGAVSEGREQPPASEAPAAEDESGRTGELPLPPAGTDEGAGVAGADARATTPEDGRRDRVLPVGARTRPGAEAPDEAPEAESTAAAGGAAATILPPPSEQDTRLFAAVTPDAPDRPRMPDGPTDGDGAADGDPGGDRPVPEPAAGGAVATGEAATVRPGSGRASRRAPLLAALAVLAGIGAITIAAVALLGGRGGAPAAVLAPTATATRDRTAAGVAGEPTTSPSAAARRATPATAVPPRPTQAPTATPTREPRATPTEEPTATPEPTSTPTEAPAEPVDSAGTPTGDTAVTPSATEDPARQPARETTATAEPTDEPGAERARPFRSGGAGLTRAAWERTYGEPASAIGGFLTYGDGDHLVRFVGGRLQFVERRWDPDDPVPLRTARSALRRFLPADAELVESAEIAEGRLLETYRSATLVERFAGVPEGNRPWIAVEPGTLLAVYRLTDGGVESVVLSVGDLP